MTTEIKQLTTRAIYKNRWLSLREDKVRFPGGHEGIYTVVEKADFAVIIPIHADGRIQLVQQYRYPVGGRYWELPQGAWEDKADVDPLELARGELAEETGLIAGRMEKLGEIFNSYGCLDQTCHMYVARDLKQGETNREATEVGMETAAFPYDELLSLIRKGEMPDSVTLSVLGYWKMIGES
ncbi:NUDIX domain-containing protein [Cohaesibacter celericrescens]|uniref:NUDIX domain-containing protein n=1 Tax=Cohaesibacter celericrescens TaxID=2067669 RepID=UPI00356A2512